MSEPITIIDVGANAGEFALPVARRNPEARVIAVEPLPDLAEALRRNAERGKANNVEILQVALGPQAGDSMFNVSELGDGGISSLLELATGDIQRDEYWRHRKDLAFSGQIPVTVVTLESVIGDLGGPRIDFIKVDAQGLDIDILRSAGRHLELIDAGMFEVPTTPGSRLYNQEQQDLRSALNWVATNGFVAYAIKPNDPACNEVNVFFCRPEIGPARLEKRLRLRGIDLYDGKHFWAIPGSTFSEFQRNHATFEGAKRAGGELRAAIVQLRELHAEVERLSLQIAGAAEALAERDQVRNELAETRRSGVILDFRNAELAGVINGLLAQLEELRSSSVADDGPETEVPR